MAVVEEVGGQTDSSLWAVEAAERAGWEGVMLSQACGYSSKILTSKKPIFSMNH